MTTPDDVANLPDRLPVEDVRFHSGGGRRATLYRGRWRQADRYHGVEVAIKQYPAGVRRDEEIWRWWQRCNDRHIVPLYHAEHAHGHDYEITLWQPAGSLRQLVGMRLDEEQLRTILEQLVHALTECHRPSGLDNKVIVHADIKPENILLATTNPLHLRLADFGSAVLLRSSRTSVRGEVDVTDAYAAHMDGRASIKGDWFSVGLVLAELACGEHLFRELVDNSHLDDGEALRNHIRSARIDVTQMEIFQRTALGDRWADLFNGLLAHDRYERWDLSDVLDWLAGRHPLPRHAPDPGPPPDEVPPDGDPRGAPVAQPTGPAFTLADWVVQTPGEMATAIGSNWQAAAEVIGGAQLTELATWAEHFDPHLGRQISLLHSVRPIDRAVARAMVAFNPRGVPVFRRYQLSGRPGGAPFAGLVALTRAALGAVLAGADDDPTVETVRWLWLSEGLLELAQLPGCAPLAEIHQDWAYLLRQGERHLELVPQYDDGPELDGVPERLRVMMLQTCLDPGYADELNRRAHDRRVWSARNRRIGWFRTLERQARDPVTGELLPDAPVLHALMLLTAPLIEQNEDLQRDPNLMAALSAEMERVVAAVDAEAASGRPSKQNLRLGMTPEEWRRRRLVVAGGVLVYLFLVTIAALGIGMQTTAGEGLLSATLLIGMGAWLPIGLRLEHGRLRRALLGGWLGGVLGLPLAAALGATASLASEPSLTWPVFWIGWIAFIVVGSAWGAAE